MGPDLGRKHRVFAVTWPLVISMILLALLWYLLWYRQTGESLFTLVNTDKYFSIVLIIATFAYAVFTSSIHDIIGKRLRSPGFQLTTLKRWSRLAGYLVFSLVWVALLRFSVVPPDGNGELWPNDLYKFYVLLMITVIFYFILEQLSITLRKFVEAKYRTRFAIEVQVKNSRRVCFISYFLLLLLTMFTNVLFQNPWLLLFSIILLQSLFPFLVIFFYAGKHTSTEESDYKKWLVKESNEEKNS